jgi:hypothetical protein
VGCWCQSLLPCGYGDAVDPQGIRGSSH